MKFMLSSTSGLNPKPRTPRPEPPKQGYGRARSGAEAHSLLAKVQRANKAYAQRMRAWWASKPYDNMGEMEVKINSLNDLRDICEQFGCMEVIVNFDDNTLELYDDYRE